MLVLAMALAATPAAVGQANGGISQLVQRPERALNMAKDQLVSLASEQGGTLDCKRVERAEVPTHGVETCWLNDGERADARFLLATKQGEARVIAASVTFKASLQQNYATQLAKRFGQPLRVTDNRWGHSTTWLQAGRQVSFRTACTVDNPCLEVSADTYARRVARSTGLFVLAVPGT